MMIINGNKKIIHCFGCVSVFCIPQRLVLALMGFLAIVNAYTMRICLNIAITEMTVNIYDNGTEEDGVCPYPEGGGGGGGGEGGGGEYEWSEKLQGFILSAFFYGYVITHLPGKSCFCAKSMINA